MIHSSNSTTNWVPILTTQSGSILTYDNWQRAGVQTISVHLEQLLMRPGFLFLDALDDLKSYYAWQGTLVLNAQLPPPNADGIYSFRSSYDGSLITIDIRTVVALIFKLKPDIVILPPEAAGLFYQFLVQTRAEMEAFIPEGEYLPGLGITAKAGLAMKFGGKDKSFEELLVAIENKQESFYLMGDFTSKELKQLAAFSHCLVESNTPTEEGRAGLMSTSTGTISMLDPSMEGDFEVIDKDCVCETCQSHLTRAYLHHLLQHTPLLAERFLIQHNVASFLKTTFTLP